MLLIVNNVKYREGEFMEYVKLAGELLDNMVLANKSKALAKLSKITHGEMFVLEMIALHDGKITPSDISKIAGTTPARVAAELKSLENKGFIRREIDVENRRKILVKITPNGKNNATKHRHEAMQIAVELLSQLGKDDAKEYVRIIGKLGVD